MRESLEGAVRLGRRMGHIFVATADARGVPHMASSANIRIEGEGLIGISEWFCPVTLSNVRVNPKIALLAWDPETDIGYQMIGTCREVQETSMMNGFSEELDEEQPIPQAENTLLVSIEKIIQFSHAPHSDAGT
ncbi:MAG: pyridoxamine 5'-phosphate oxidase family protein [Desulfobacterales bacterium]